MINKIISVFVLIIALIIASIPLVPNEQMLDHRKIEACAPAVPTPSAWEHSNGGGLFLIEDNMGDMHPVSLEEFLEASPSGYGILVLDSGTHELVIFEGHPSEIGRDLRVALWIKVHSGPYG